MTVSAAMRLFCLEMLAAIEEPPNRQPHWFTFDAGLCYNAFRYDRAHEIKTDICYELHSIFHRASEGNSARAMHPFNQGNDMDYLTECKLLAVYRNEKRMAFLRENAGKFL